METVIVHSLLLYNIDEEDNWLKGCLSFPIEPCKTYKVAFDQVKHQLEDPLVLAHIVKENWLISNCFYDDSSYVFESVIDEGGRVAFHFRSTDDDVAVFRMKMELIRTVIGL